MLCAPTSRPFSDLCKLEKVGLGKLNATEQQLSCWLVLTLDQRGLLLIREQKPIDFKRGVIGGFAVME